MNYIVMSRKINEYFPNSTMSNIVNTEGIKPGSIYRIALENFVWVLIFDSLVCAPFHLYTNNNVSKHVISILHAFYKRHVTKLSRYISGIMSKLCHPSEKKNYLQTNKQTNTFAFVILVLFIIKINRKLGICGKFMIAW